MLYDFAALSKALRGSALSGTSSGFLGSSRNSVSIPKVKVPLGYEGARMENSRALKGATADGVREWQVALKA